MPFSKDAGTRTSQSAEDDPVLGNTCAASHRVSSPSDDDSSDKSYNQNQIASIRVATMVYTTSMYNKFANRDRSESSNSSSWRSIIDSYFFLVKQEHIMGDTAMAHPATEPSNSHFHEDTSSGSQREWERNTSGYIFESINASDLDIKKIPKSGSTSKAEDTPTGAESPSNDGGAPRQSSTESNAPHHAPIGKDEAIAESNLINGDRLDNERFAPEEKESIPDHQIERSALRPKFSCFAEYQQAYQASISNPEAFWASEAREKLHWFQDFVTTHTGSFESGNNAWFVEGRLNASYNCIDRHAFANPESLAIIYEADEPGQDRKLTYGDLLGEVSRLAFVLVDLGVAKGDIVVIYLPNIPEALIAMLACARIGAIHSVVFMGFSSISLQDRIRDAKSKVVITSDEARRGGKAIPTKRIVNDALLQCPLVQNCIILKHTGSEVPWSNTRDVWWHEEARKWPPYFPPVSLSAEDPLFLLYTSGSTGKPKGLMHTTAGYLVGAAITTEYVFNMHRSDVHFCAGDVGWITGHTYLVYGPLLLGATTIVFEGTPTYPTFSRLWNIIDHHNVTHFYAAPTVLRILKRAGEPITASMKRLRVLGSIGEPIAPEVWRWYHETVGRKRAYVVDTYFQTETGCHVIAPLAQAIPVKPGCCTVPFLGVEPGIIDPHSGLELEGNGVEGILAIKRPWPSMARTVWRAHERYMDTYFKLHPGYYFTGDGAYRDEDGYYWIRGRVDDVVNVSGHRLSTAELEAALLESGIVAEAAVVGINDSMTGQALAAYVSLKKELEPTLDLQKILIEKVRKTIGAFVAPKLLYFVTDLPKTRSGKIMRRILKKILEGERDNFGDTSTLVNSESISTVIREVERPATTVSAQ